MAQQIGVVVENAGGHVCAKMVFSGDMDTVAKQIEELKTKYADYTFTEYESDLDQAFVDAEVEQPELLTR